MIEKSAMCLYNSEYGLIIFFYRAAACICNSILILQQKYDHGKAGTGI